ncbi:MAG: ABC transporter permease [Vicinamibacterales bacterium]
MDFHDYVRDRLPPLTIAREPEILHELAQHLSDVYDEARAEGATHEAAVARAHAALPQRGDRLASDIESASRALPGLIADRWRLAGSEPLTDTRRLRMLSDLRQDVRYAARSLAASPAFAIVVFLTLALGIGATAVIFTAIDAILLNTPGVSNTESLASVYNASTDGRERFSTLSYPDFADLRGSGVFQDLAAFGGVILAYDGGGQAESIQGEIVTGNFFDVLGTRVSPGRGFLPSEDERGTATRAVVVSHAFWQNHLGASPGVIGTPVSLNGQLYTIVGVAPPLFVGATIGRAPEVWVPMAHQQEIRPPSAGLRRSLGSADLLHARGPRWLSAIARLKPGTTRSEATAGADVVARRLQSAYPDTNRYRAVNVVPLGEGPGVRASARPLLGLLSAAVLLVLLIACANVASVLLARGVSRRREVAVRMAVGARQSRLIRQWLTESVMLSVVGGAGGLLLAHWSAPLLHLAGIPEAVHLGTNSRVLVFTFAVAVVSGIAFGLAPVLQTLRSDTLSALRDEGGAIASGNYASRLRRAFVVVQVAVSLMLLVGAGLFLRTLQNAHAVDLGYRLDSTMVADINLDVRGYSQEAGRVAYRQVLDGLRAIPGVRAAGAARVTVLSGGARTVWVSVDGRPLERDGSNAIDVRVNIVTDGYLDALGIPIVRGRDFSAADDWQKPRVAIVSRHLAARLWPNEDPIGKTLVDGQTATVVGMVPDTVYRSALERDAPPFYYLPLAQNYEAGVALHIRAAQGDPLGLLPAVRAAVRAVDPAVVVARPQRLRSLFEDSLAAQRMLATLVGLFGVVALTLAAVGLYGVMAHLAGQRRTEIGIRLALGASPSSILRLIVTEGMRLVLVGAAMGLFGAIASTRWISSQLFGIHPTDPVTFVAGCVLLGIVAALACLIPARRAMRVDPSAALRNA